MINLIIVSCITGIIIIIIIIIIIWYIFDKV